MIMTKIIGGRRQCGKTTELIKRSAETNTYILTVNRERALMLSRAAQDLKLDIPFPITVNEVPLRGSFIRKVLIDDVEDVLRKFIGLEIEAMSTSCELVSLPQVNKRVGWDK